MAPTTGPFSQSSSLISDTFTSETAALVAEFIMGAENEMPLVVFLATLGIFGLLRLYFTCDAPYRLALNTVGFNAELP